MITKNYLKDYYNHKISTKKSQSHLIIIKITLKRLEVNWFSSTQIQTVPVFNGLIMSLLFSSISSYTKQSQVIFVSRIVAMYIFICQQIHAVGWDLSNTNVKATMKKSAFTTDEWKGRSNIVLAALFCRSCKVFMSTALSLTPQTMSA